MTKRLAIALMLLVFAIFATTGCGGGETANSAEDMISIEVFNRSDTVIISYALFYGPDLDEWGEELLGDEVIEPGESYTFMMPEDTYTMILMTYEYYIVEGVRDISEDIFIEIGGEDKATIMIVNQTESDIGFVYLSPVEKEDWGENRLGTEVIPAGIARILFVDPGEYDFLAADINGDEVSIEFGIEIEREEEKATVLIIE